MHTLDLTAINFLLPSSVDPINFCGVYDSNLRCLERNTGVQIIPNSDGSFLIKGESSKVLHTKMIMEQMIKISPIVITHKDIDIFSDTLSRKRTFIVNNIATEGLVISKSIRIKPYTKHQEEYINQILMHDITFGVGPAGTGKTYVAMAVALRELKLGNVKKIILTRPIVETDEHLGFLPGTLEEKIDPYIRPLYDAIFDMITMVEFEQLSSNGQIELAPLAYMRGRTLADSFIILDEAQNATINQMKMFLTRLGKNSKIVVTGDISQIDLQKDNSGLIDALNKLQHIKGISIYNFIGSDTVRHGLVKKIIEAYA